MNSLFLWYLRNFPIDYGKRYLANLVSIPSGEVTYTNRWGVKFRLEMSEYQMRTIFLYDLYEKNTLLNLVKIVKVDDVFIDVGANIGSYSFNIAKFNINGKVLSFEPNPRVQHYFKLNFLLNAPSNVTLYPMGLSNHSGKNILNFDSNNIGASSMYRSDGSESQQIELIKLDDFCTEKGVNKIDVIKVDIEGEEFNFLLGAENTIKRNKKMIIVIEMMNENFVRAGYTSKEVFAYLEKLGFKAYLPKILPFRLERIRTVDFSYQDNLFFIRE